MEAVADFLAGVLVEYAAVLPDWFISILVIMGTLHAIIPLVMAAIQAIVVATPSKKDDEVYEQVASHKVFVYFKAVVKWVSGLDLDQIKKKKAEKK